jgi:hypothetical protein
VAAELANTYKVPILIYPVSYMPAGTKAPMVWYGGENIAASGGKLNGMIFGLARLEHDDAHASQCDYDASNVPSGRFDAVHDPEPEQRQALRPCLSHR